jgi:hypothetical protein
MCACYSGRGSDRQAIATLLICERGQEDGRHDMARSGHSPMQLRSRPFSASERPQSDRRSRAGGHSAAANGIASSSIPQWCPRSLLNLRHHGGRPRFGRCLQRFHAHCLPSVGAARQLMTSRKKATNCEQVVYHTADQTFPNLAASHH